LTPLEIVQELSRLTQENSKGVNALFEAESALAHAEADLDKVEQMAFLKAQGTVADRTAIAKLEAADKRLERDITKAQFNRIKQKIRAIEQAQLALSVQAKLMGVDARL
jgi:hypothetical protein